jgi:predicted metal-dependent HD superfamily phosphohydrolase
VSGLYSELADHYGEPPRYYHNLYHIEALLQLYIRFENVLSKPDVVLFSIFYHDVVYVPGKADNEHQSALLAGRALKQLGVPAEIIAEVQQYIEATSSHRLSPTADEDLKLFIDFDLSILAAAKEAYRAYLLQVRKEYSHLSDGQFAQGRSVFLQRMLRQEHIFYTESFCFKEEEARKNMLWELQMNPGIYSAR